MEPACRNPDFLANGGIKGHFQSIHGGRPSRYQIASCMHREKGFGRKGGLVKHPKRVHSYQKFQNDGISLGSRSPIPGMDDDLLSSDVSQQNSESQYGIAETRLKVAG